MTTATAKRTKGKAAPAKKTGRTTKKYSISRKAFVVLAEQRRISPIYAEQPELFDRVTVIPRTRGSRRIAFGWYGGKFSHLEWLLPMLPKAHHYCEPYSGSAAVLLNRETSPVETYNDIDGDVVNFFRVLRDRHEELVRSIALTPFSREEFHIAVSGSMQGVSDLERARRFYIRARQARTDGACTDSDVGALG